MKPTWSTAWLYTEHGWNWPMLADHHIQTWILNQLWHCLPHYYTGTTLHHCVWYERNRQQSGLKLSTLMTPFPEPSQFEALEWIQVLPTGSKDIPLLVYYLGWPRVAFGWRQKLSFLFDHPLCLPEFKVGWLPLWYPDHVDGLELQHTGLVHCVSQWCVDRDIDGFHSIFSLGNWRAFHHHAACWFVNIHSPHDPFALQFLWWNMLWNPSIPYKNMDSNTVHRGCLPHFFNTRWDLLLPMS